MTVADLLALLERIAPSSLAFSFDKIGLQVGSSDWPCEKVAVSLDSGLGAVAFAREVGADVLLCHHPLIWEPLTALNPDNLRTKAAMELAEARIAFIAAHTNWDCAPDGLNDELAERLNLTDVRPFGSSRDDTAYFPAGRIGRLPRPMSLAELAHHADESLATKSIAWAGAQDAIEWLAVIGGAADSDWPAALEAGAHAFLTGEIKQNNALEASESGLAMLASGHYGTEHPGCDRLCRRLIEAGFDAVLYTPEPGESGRPV
jgi:dinuclear metal center YbgI/SA1388 family protein